MRHTIRRRLDPLPADVARTLTAAAVIGPEFSLETLSLVVQQERVALLGQLDEAAAARLVEEVPGLLGRYRFAHGLIRETLYDDLPAQDRVALHAAIGEALLALYGDRPDAPLSELAHHFLQAAPAGDAARAADYAARAGEHALESMAWEQAIDLFDDALTALDLQLDDPGRRGAVLLSKGRAEMRAGRHDAGRATLGAAAEVGRRLGDEALLAQAALASAPPGLATALADEQRLIPLLEEALERLPAADGDLRARLLARLAAALYWSAPAERRESLALEAIAMARRLGDPATLALVLSDAHLATWDPDSPERALPWAGEIATLAAKAGNMELAMLAHSWRISLLLARGELEVVDREMDAYADAAERLHQQRAKAQALLHRCARLLMAGEFDEAERAHRTDGRSTPRCCRRTRSSGCASPRSCSSCARCRAGSGSSRLPSSSSPMPSPRCRSGAAGSCACTCRPGARPSCGASTSAGRRRVRVAAARQPVAAVARVRGRSLRAPG